jgi:hypothetical protein
VHRQLSNKINDLQLSQPVVFGSSEITEFLRECSAETAIPPLRSNQIKLREIAHQDAQSSLARKFKNITAAKAEE